MCREAWKAEARCEPLWLEIGVWVYTADPLRLFLSSAMDPQVEVSETDCCQCKELSYPSPPKGV